MAAGAEAEGIFQWEKSLLSGLTLTPSNILYGMAGLILIATYLRMKMLRNAAARGGKAGRTASGHPDKVWNLEGLRQGTAELVRKIQSAWAQGNPDKLKACLEPILFEEWSPRMAGAKAAESAASALHAALQEVAILGITGSGRGGGSAKLSAKSAAKKSEHEFMARMRFLTADGGGFSEDWKLARDGDALRLKEVIRDGQSAGISLALGPAA